MNLSPHVQKRFADVTMQGESMFAYSQTVGRIEYVVDYYWLPWVANALNLVSYTCGEPSVLYERLKTAISEGRSNRSARAALAVFKAVKTDLEAGVVGSLEQRVSGELFAGFIATAKAALHEGQKDVAAVLACAALEDTLKRYATLNGINIQGKTMDNVIGALKGSGLVSGAQKGLLDAMPRIRNAAMHADWQKITEPDVASVIGFTEQFLLTHLS